MGGERVQADLSVALELATRADAITLDRFGALDLRVDTKPDLTPVTDADEAVEAELRNILGRERPDDAVLGEEYGGTAAFRGRQWVIDPIDGTKNFVRGVPVWATLIALLEDGVPVVGVVSAPALNRRWWAGRGLGAFAAVGDVAPRRLSVSGVADLESASLSFSSLSGWADLRLRDRFVGLTDAVWRVRAYGDFFSYCLVAEGPSTSPPSRRSSSGISPRSTSWCARQAVPSPAWMAHRVRTGAPLSPPTDCSTARCFPASPRCEVPNRIAVPYSGVR